MSRLSKYELTEKGQRLHDLDRKLVLPGNQEHKCRPFSAKIRLVDDALAKSLYERADGLGKDYFRPAAPASRAIGNPSSPAKPTKTSK